MQQHRELYKNFITLLAESRRAKGITQAQLAKKLDKPQSYVSKFESGERRLDVIEFILIAECLGLSPNTLINNLKKYNKNK